MNARLSCAVVALSLTSALAGCVGVAQDTDWPPARVAAEQTRPSGQDEMPPPLPVVPMPAIHPVTAPPSGQSKNPTISTVAPTDETPVWDDYLGSSRLQIAAIQTLIDREHFSPGVIDGIWGPKSETALKAWQQKRGLSPTGEPDRQTLDAFGPLKQAFQTYVITDADHRDLAPTPATWAAKSQVERLGYECVEERIAERFHCSRSFLRFLNPDAAWPNPPVGTALKVPDVTSVPYPTAARIEINLSKKILRVFDSEERMVALFPCSIGRDRARIPRGELHVVAWAENPEYYFDPAVFPEDPEARTLNRKLILPPGPNNPVGTAWISLSLPGYGIHGTPHPEDIGKTESHGCFRLTNWNAAKLIRMVQSQTPVHVVE